MNAFTHPTGFAATPGPLAPHHLHRPSHARRVDQPHRAPAVAVGDHPADPAALLPWR
jgi:hypothetical protein